MNIQEKYNVKQHAGGWGLFGFADENSQGVLISLFGQKAPAETQRKALIKIEMDRDEANRLASENLAAKQEQHELLLELRNRLQVIDEKINQIIAK